MRGYKKGGGKTGFSSGGVNEDVSFSCLVLFSKVEGLYTPGANSLGQQFTGGTV